MANKKSYNRWWTILTIALVSIPVFIFFGLGGYMAGEEFSPDDFSRRKFSYNVMPLSGITLWGIGYEDSTPIFEQSLFNDGLIGKARSIKKWDLVWDLRTNSRSPDLDAGLLCKVLDLSDENDESIWIKWNEDHPKLATLFWPVIADMARQGLYIDAANIMLRGVDLQVGQADDYWLDVIESGTTALNRLAHKKLAAGDHKAATELFSSSIGIKPTQQAFLGRADGYQNLGEQVKSEADYQAAIKISKTIENK